MATETKLAGLLERYEELERAGQAPAAEELCRDCPELCEELKRRIEIRASAGRGSAPSQTSDRETQSAAEGLAGTLRPGSLIDPPNPSDSAPPTKSTLAETTGMEIRPGSEPVPGYQLVGRLGRGNFGEVWKATAPGGFPVALKLMPLGEKVKATELHALEIIKTIRHPNLVTAFGAWQLQGFLIVAMELADRTLWDRYQEAASQGLPGIPAAELLEYFRQAAKGIDYLNQRQHTFEGKQPVSIQHRDIKPQNILLVGSGVKVADFGLVRLLDRAMTGHTGNMTPAYAAPEFLQGQTSNQSDQYCLAVTYCELRGGRLPFEGTLAQVLNGHLANAPDLDMLPAAERPVVARALEKEPGKRWPSCQAFIEALAESMQRPVVPRRKAKVAHWVAAVLVPVLVGLAVAFLPRPAPTPPGPSPPAGSVSIEEPASAQSQADVVKNEPVREPTRDAIEQAPQATVATTDRAPDTQQPIDAKPAADAANESATTSKAPSVTESKASTPEPQTPTAVDVPKVVVTDIPRAAPTPADNPAATAAVADPPRQDRPRELVRFVQHRGEVRSVAVSPTGGQAISGGDDGIVWLWDVETGQQLHRFDGHAGPVHCVAFSRDGRLAISGGEDKSVRIWDIEARKALGTLNGHTQAVFAVTFLSDNQRAISGGQDTTVRVWNIADGKDVKRLDLPSRESVFSLSLSRDDRHVLTASDSQVVRLWDVERANEVHRFEDHRDVVWCVAYSADGTRALSGGGVNDGRQDYSVRLWDVENRNRIRDLKGHTGPVVSVAFSSDGRRAVSGSADKTLRLWDVDSGAELHCFEGHDASVHGVAISRDGRRALSASGDGTVRVWVLPP